MQAHFSLVIITLLFTVYAQEKSRKLLVILLDGFRWNYLKYDGFGEGGFHRLAREGTVAEYLKPAFPSLTFPNFYSLMTGLHTESHGMTDNFMYDTGHDASFVIGKTTEYFEPYWWNDAEPVWVSATKQNKNCYMFYWLGCNVKIRGVLPKFCDPYLNVVPTLKQFRSAITQTAQLFQNESADLAAIYFENTDHQGHRFGPFSDVVNKTLKLVDGEFAFLLDELDRRGIRNDVDVMVVSDHGMTGVTLTAERGLINISTVLSSDEYSHMMSRGPIVSIFTCDDRLQQVYKKLKIFHPHLHVYLRHEIPDRWHYKHGRLVAPLVLTADLGWFIVTPEQPDFPVLDDGFHFKGIHGYDNDLSDMHGIFLASGPSFKKNYKSGPKDMVQLYQVMCRILDITPSPNNGSWSQVVDILDPSLTK